MGRFVYAPDRGSAGGGSGDATRNARYAYLVGRLRNRQMTMEEATELFSVMQGMLQTSEAARAVLMRSPPPPPSAARPAAAPRPPAAPTAGGDDLLLIGLLAMGAGAGLLAAMTKRFQELSAPPGPAPSSGPASRASSPKG